MSAHDETWLDGDAGPLTRPYTVTMGRTAPTRQMDILSMVTSTGRVSHAQLTLDHGQALDLCSDPISVVEVSARLHLPVTITKILISDLVECGAVVTHDPNPTTDPINQALLEKLLDALQRQL